MLTEKERLKYYEELEKLADSDDPESAHWQGDCILCEILVKLGYADIVSVWKEIEKWYS